MPFLGASSGSFFAGRRRSLPTSVDIFFSKGSDFRMATGDGDYDPVPKGGIVYGDLPESVLSATPGSSIVVPGEGNLQRGERYFYFVAGQRVVPDHYIPLTFRGWSDGAREYYPGDEYVIPFNDVTFTATWDIGRTSGLHSTVRNTLGGPNGASTEEASPGDKLYFHANVGTHLSYKSVASINFIGAIDGTSGGTTVVSYSAQFNVINNSMIEVIVPEIPVTSNRLYSAPNRYSTFVSIILPAYSVTFPNGSVSTRNTSLPPTSGSPSFHRFITIV